MPVNFAGFLIDRDRRRSKRRSADLQHCVHNTNDVFFFRQREHIFRFTIKSLLQPAANRDDQFSRSRARILRFRRCDSRRLHANLHATGKKLSLDLNLRAFTQLNSLTQATKRAHRRCKFEVDAQRATIEPTLATVANLAATRKRRRSALVDMKMRPMTAKVCFFAILLCVCARALDVQRCAKICGGR